MKRITTDTPQGNLEIALNLFYIKDHETWVRGGGPAPDFKDVSLFDFTRSLIKAHIPTIEIPENDDDFSFMMAEWLFDDVDSAEGTIATLYAAAWAYAELRHRLMAYEDTGLEPEEVNDAVVGAKLMAKSKITAAFGVEAERLRELAQADNDGRLVVLPCRVGDTLYRICHEFRQGNPYIRTVTFNRNNFWRIVFGGEFGKTVFLTREEAEAALEGGGHE